jgi:hypothetical protein
MVANDIKAALIHIKVLRGSTPSRANATIGAITPRTPVKKVWTTM